MGYLDFLSLETGAAVVVTDWGGVQEETLWLSALPDGVRRDRAPVTVAEGTNTLVVRDAGRSLEAIEQVPAGRTGGTAG